MKKVMLIPCCVKMKLYLILLMPCSVKIELLGKG